MQKLCKMSLIINLKINYFRNIVFYNVLKYIIRKYSFFIQVIRLFYKVNGQRYFFLQSRIENVLLERSIDLVKMVMGRLYLLSLIKERFIYKVYGMEYGFIVRF